jgi:hypothetical protein
MVWCNKVCVPKHTQAGVSFVLARPDRDRGTEGGGRGEACWDELETPCRPGGWTLCKAWCQGGMNGVMQQHCRHTPVASSSLARKVLQQPAAQSHVVHVCMVWWTKWGMPFAPCASPGGMQQLQAVLQLLLGMGAGTAHAQANMFHMVGSPVGQPVHVAAAVAHAMGGLWVPPAAGCWSVAVYCHTPPTLCCHARLVEGPGDVLSSLHAWWPTLHSRSKHSHLHSSPRHPHAGGDTIQINSPPGSFGPPSHAPSPVPLFLLVAQATQNHRCDCASLSACASQGHSIHDHVCVGMSACQVSCCCCSCGALSGAVWRAVYPRQQQQQRWQQQRGQQLAAVARLPPAAAAVGAPLVGVMCPCGLLAGVALGCLLCRCDGSQGLGMPACVQRFPHRKGHEFGAYAGMCQGVCHQLGRGPNHTRRSPSTSHVTSNLLAETPVNGGQQLLWYLGCQVSRCVLYNRGMCGQRAVGLLRCPLPTLLHSLLAISRARVLLCLLAGCLKGPAACTPPASCCWAG